MASQKKTNAVRILENAKIPFELIEYEVDESSLSAEDAALRRAFPRNRPSRRFASEVTRRAL